MLDLSTIPFHQSPNCYLNRGQHTITHIVIHAMMGTMAGTAKLFSTPNMTSANYGVSRKGDAVQYVKDEQAAWHVCNANRFCLGVEHEDMWLDPTGNLIGGCNSNIPWTTKPQLDTSAQLVAQLMLKHNVPLANVIGHNDPYLIRFGNNHSDPGKLWPWPGYKLLLQEYIVQLTPKPVNKGGRPRKVIIDMN